MERRAADSAPAHRLSWEESADERRKSVRHHRALAVVGCIVYVLFGGFYYLLGGDAYGTAAFVCLCWVSPGLAVIGAMTFLEVYRRRPYPLLTVAGLLVWVPAGIAFARGTPPRFDLYLLPSLMIMSLCFFAAMRMPLRHVTLLALGYQASTVGTALVVGRWQGETLVQMLAALVSCDLIGLTIGYQVTSGYVRDFVQARRLAEEQAKSERLLHDILPAPVAARLKEGASGVADQVGSVTVLFTDFMGFTSLAASLPPAEVVHLLDEVFSRFDVLAERFGVERIKTIGDAYMAVAGLTDRTEDHAARAARLALGMLDVIRTFNASHGHALGLRIGLATGPVIAGVIGRKRPSYDVWGDTVNLASRMVSQGEPGRIQLTDATARAAGQGFALQERGPVMVKGRGEMTTYWLVAEEPSGVVPAA